MAHALAVRTMATRTAIQRIAPPCYGARATKRLEKNDGYAWYSNRWDTTKGGEHTMSNDKNLFTPLGLDHVVLRVADPARSQRFYIEALGCTLDHVNERISLTQLRFGDQLIDLLPATSAAPVGGGID